MQVFLSVCILLLSILAYDLMGRAFCIKCRYSPVLPERICIGFFLYFAAFQIVALIMIFTRQKLHVLGAVWLVLLLLLSAASAAIAAGHKKRERVQRKCAPTVISVRPSGAARAVFTYDSGGDLRMPDRIADAAQYWLGFCLLYRKYDDVCGYRYDVCL